MSNPTPAQEEFADLLAKNNRDESRVHPEDRDAEASDDAYHSEDEEELFRAQQIEAAMRMPTMDGRAHTSGIRLPPASFDSGCATGVKGVIADARSYEMARRGKWKDRARAVRRSVFGMDGAKHDRSSGAESEGSGAEDLDLDDDSFLQQWREIRRRELEAEGKTPVVVRNRRTSPSLRIYGHLDEVDADGYLRAVEDVLPETVVVVFVYDHECAVSSMIEHAMMPLVSSYPVVHFVKVHYEDIEFDNAGVPALLAYRNKGDLFANLTGVMEMMPDDGDFAAEALKKLFLKHGIL
ncbi:thioredoxin-like protein [Podospora appendiculata]|uniref:Thioredoxin-like protein n=1 Tax=Podospora appendiculata TaxID=314037 RepID=A0AAE0XFK6_9PEZI|nr:thioredoxin-like protein [Podospora appendiculata]